MFFGYLDNVCPNPGPLKRTHLPQGMLSFIDPTGCCVMKRKDGKCYVQAITRDPDLDQQYIGKPVDDMDYVWGDNESIINSSTIPEAKLYKQHHILSFHYIRSMISQGYINL